MCIRDSIQTKTAVKNAADLAGMKLRAAGTGVPVLKALGAAPLGMPMPEVPKSVQTGVCILYTSDAADDLLCVDLGGRPFIKKKKHNNNSTDTS